MGSLPKCRQLQDTSVRTDENRVIPLNFGSFRIRLEPNNTIALDHLRLNTQDLLNVRDHRQWVTLVFQTGISDAPAVTSAPQTGPLGDDASSM